MAVLAVWAQDGAAENSAASKVQAIAKLFEIFMLPPPPKSVVEQESRREQRWSGGKAKR
jgi:hypothetical protein